MERDLVSSKVKMLEDLLGRQSKLSAAEERDIQDRIDRLKNYDKRKNGEEEETATVADDKTGETPNEEEEPKDFFDSFLDTLLDDEDEENNAKNKEPVEKLTPEEEEAMKEVKDIFLEIKDILGEVVETSKDAEDKEFWDEILGLESDLNNTLAGNVNMTREELDLLMVAQEAVSSVAAIFDINRTGWEWAKNNFKQEVVDIKEESAKDPLYVEKVEALAKIVPPQILDCEVSQRLNATEMETFVKQVMLPIDNVFSLSSINAKKLRGVYLLEGTPKVKSGKEVIESIGKQLEETGLMADEIQPGFDKPNIGQIIERVSNIVKPAILVSPKGVDFSPNTDTGFRSTWLGVSLISVAAFAGGCYEPDMNTMQRLLVGFTSPIFLGIIGIQLVHELGHFIGAAVHKVRLFAQSLLYAESFLIL
ncbi:MAG: hypothetical protein SGARI_001083 [Bacillariaceae sp.]